MRTLKDIEYNIQFEHKDIFKAALEFVWALKWDIDEIISSHSLMYKEWTDISNNNRKVVDKNFWIHYWNAYSFKVELQLDWILAEFFNEEETYLLLPKLLNWPNTRKIEWELILKYIIRDLVKTWYLSDKYYLLIAPILKSFSLWYNERVKRIWFVEDFVVEKLESQWIWNNKLWILKTKKIITNEELLEKELSLWYINKAIWDKERWFGYTHSLRQHANYYMLQWTRRVIMNWSKINVVAASKWNGKSYFAAELCAAELIREWKWFWWRKKRQIKYFVPDLNTVGSNVMEYMEWFLWDLTRLKVDWEPVIKINRSKYEITCSLTWTTFKMISLYWFWSWGSTWEWLACDFAVIDEAAYIPNEFWTMFSQRAMMETESMLVITTISEKTPREHWFYSLLIDWELWDELISSHRVDMLEKRELYELDYKANNKVETELDIFHMNKKLNEIMTFTMDSIKKMWYKEYYARAFCVILDERNVFNIVWSIFPDLIIPPDTKDRFIISMDFWWNSDPAWLNIINITKRQVVYSEEIRWVPYLEQLQIVKEWKKRYKHTIAVWDATTIGKVIMQEDKDNIIDYWVQFTWAWDYSYNNKWFYVASKTHMVEKTALMLDKWVLRIWQSNSILVNQMKNFVKITWTKSLVNKYQWKWNMHDDLVDSLMLNIFVIVTVLWLYTDKEWESYWTEFDYIGEDYYNEENYIEEYQYGCNVY